MPISPGLGALLAPVVGGVAGSIFGGTDQKTQAAVPKDLMGMRGQNIDLLSYLLGFPGMGAGGGGAMGGMGGGLMGRVFGGGGTGGGPMGGQFGGGSWANIMGGGRGGPPGGMMGGPSDPGTRLESFFGGLTSPLQRQATGSMSQFLNQPSPESKAMDQSMPALQAILGGKPGQGIMDALGPMFYRNLASANQQGGRFGSGNAILRSRAVDDFNLVGDQAAQQGIDQQMQAAQILGMLGQSAGSGPWGRMMGAMQAGDVEPQRRIALMQQLLGTSQAATLGQPTTIQPSGTQQGMGMGFDFAQLLAMLGGGGGGNIFGGGGRGGDKSGKAWG